MTEDKFMNIVNKLKNDEQPIITSPKDSQEGLRSVNEGLRRSNYSLSKDEGHIVELSTKDETKKD